MEQPQFEVITTDVIRRSVPLHSCPQEAIPVGDEESSSFAQGIPIVEESSAAVIEEEVREAQTSSSRNSSRYSRGIISPRKNLRSFQRG